MKQYCLRIHSKNEKSLKKFLHFFFKHLKTKFNIIKQSTTNRISRKIITFLKSPHVNKSAQDHFEMHTFINKVFIRGFYLEKKTIFLKKVLDKLFQDIYIDLELSTNKKANKKNSSFLFSPNNNKLLKNKSPKQNFKRYKQKNLLEKLNHKKSYLIHLIKFLKAINVFGEIATV